MKRLSRRALLAGLAGLTGCTGRPSGNTDSSTPQTARNASNGGPSTGPPIDEPEVVTPDDDAVVWAVSFDESVTRPAVSEGAVYVGVGRTAPSAEDAGAGGVASLALADGAHRWSASLPAPVAKGPLVRDGVVYVVSGESTGYTGNDQRLNAVVDGERRWASDAVDQFLELLGVGEGRAYLGTADDALSTDGQELFAVDRSDGTTTWTRASGDAIGGRLVGGRLVVDVGGVAVEVRDPADGTRSWQREVELLDGPDGAPQVVDGAVLAAENREEGEQFAAFDLADGTRRWSSVDGGERPYVFTGATAGEEVAVGVEYDGAVFALGARDGAGRWRFATDGDVRTSPLVDDGAVVVGDLSGTVYSLDAADGTERWQADVGGPVRWLGTTGDLVVAATYPEDGQRVVGFSAADGDRRWRYASGIQLSRPSLAGDTAVVGDEEGVLRVLGEA